MRILSIVAVALFLTQGMAAQNTEDIKKEINNVKRSNSYIYAEATASTMEEAKAVAEDGVMEKVGTATIVLNTKTDEVLSYSMK